MRPATEPRKLLSPPKTKPRRAALGSLRRSPSSPGPREWLDVCLDRPKPWYRGPDRVGDIRGRQMPVMLLNHARIGMTKVLRDDEQRRTIHDRMTGIGVS